MKHSRSDYQNRIVDLANLIPENEPVFLLRAKDACALAALHAYYTELINKRANRDIIANVGAALLMFQKFRNENGDKMKLPDISEGQEMPRSDHPLLTQALNTVKNLEQKNTDLAVSLSRVQGIADEYSERYSDLKRLYEDTVEQLEAAKSNGLDIMKSLNDKGAELTQLKADILVLSERAETAESKLSAEIKLHETTLQVLNETRTELENTKSALKRSVDVENDLGSQG